MYLMCILILFLLFCVYGNIEKMPIHTNPVWASAYELQIQEITDPTKHK